MALNKTSNYRINFFSLPPNIIQESADHLDWSSVDQLLQASNQAMGVGKSTFVVTNKRDLVTPAQKTFITKIIIAQSGLSIAQMDLLLLNCPHVSTIEISSDSITRREADIITATASFHPQITTLVVRGALTERFQIEINKRVGHKPRLVSQKKKSAYFTYFF